MLKKLHLLFSYLNYLRKAKTKYDIHSPFVFDFITKVIEDKNKYVSYKKVEELRGRLLRNRNMIEVVDFGASAEKTGYKTTLERVSNIAKRSSISPKQGQLLHRIVRYSKPEILLELGISLGVSSMYQATGWHDSFLIGIEGCATTAAIAEQNLSKVTDQENYSIVIGEFDNMLKNVLMKLDKIDFIFIDGNHAYKATLRYFTEILPHTHESSIMILHDIHWSSDMEKAWDEIKKNENISITIDLFAMGIVFFRKGIPKQDFIIRF